MKRIVQRMSDGTHRFKDAKPMNPEEMKRNVMKFIQANPNYPKDRLVKKFGLIRKVKKVMKNGIKKVGYFYGGKEILDLYE